MADFPPLVEFWRSYFANADCSIPTDFILRWAQVESGGNPCSYTSMHESGIIQLMPPQDTNLGGTSEAALRQYCVGSSQTMTVPSIDQFPQDGIDTQVESGVTFINALRDKAHGLLSAAGQDWDESTPDFWSMVKLLHSLPSLAQFLQIAAQSLGRGPASWDEFASFVPANVGGYDAAHWMSVSADVGSYGAGGGCSSLTRTNRFLLAGAAGLLFGILLAFRGFTLPWSKPSA